MINTSQALCNAKVLQEYVNHCFRMKGIPVSIVTATKQRPGHYLGECRRNGVRLRYVQTRLYIRLSIWTPKIDNYEVQEPYFPIGL